MLIWGCSRYHCYSYWPEASHKNITQVYIKNNVTSEAQEIQYKGGVKQQIQHDAKLNAVFDMRSHPNYCTSWVKGALTDLLFYIGKISSCSSDGLGMWWRQ